jgi:3-deoxy-D-manno-octulosonic-acid transferase
MYLATPLILVHLAVRGFRDHGYWKRWGERFCLAGPDARAGCVHIHAASVGEVNAASPLVNALLEQHPERDLLITTFTPTGSRRVRALWAGKLTHVFVPLDLPGAARRFFRRHRPSLQIVVETEIWPNLYFHAAKNDVPLIMINARLSARSTRRYRRVGSLVASTLGATSRILAQSAPDAERFLAVGADPGKLEIAGNLKFDVSLSPTHVEAGESLKAAWGVNRPVLTAGSTHEEDELALLEAFTQVLEQHPTALLVLVPRHPERFNRTVQLAREQGLETTRFSEGARVGSETRCLVIDAMGELLNYYAAGDVAFLGGTIAPVGGHNPLEPAALARPLLIGPHRANIQVLSETLVEAKAAWLIDDSTALSGAICQLFDSGELRDDMGQAGLRLVESGRGALDRTLTAVNALL